MQTNSYPEHPGYQGRTEASKATSREAADKIAPVAKTQAQKVLAELLAALPEGRSSEQIAAATGIVVYSVRARMPGLVDAGKVEATKEKTKNAEGNSVIIWKAVK